MRTFLIDVTAQDIRDGLQNACKECPIALAAKRAGIDDPSVGANLDGWTGTVEDRAGKTAPLPAAALRFISRFDAGQPVEPLSFTVKFLDVAA